MLRVGFCVVFILGGEFKGCVRPTLRVRNRFSSNKNRAVRHNAILTRVIKPAVKGIAAPPTPTGFIGCGAKLEVRPATPRTTATKSYSEARVRGGEHRHRFCSPCQQLAVLVHPDKAVLGS